MITTKKRTPGAHQAAKDYILKNYLPGDRLPGESELIKKIGASRYAVLRGLTELSAEGLLERRQGQGTFMTPPSKRKNNQSSNIVAFVADEFESNMTVEIARGIEEYLRQRKMKMLLLNSHFDSETEYSNLAEAVDQRCAGIIALLSPNRKTLKKAAELTANATPLIQIDRHYKTVNSPWIETDHEQGAYEAVRYLIELGHRKIAHITLNKAPNEGLSSVKQRLDGYKRAMNEAGIEIKNEYIQNIRRFALNGLQVNEAVEMAAYEPAHKLIAMPVPPTALFLLNDCLAPGVYRAAKNQGLRIPEDISIIGFDDGPIARYLETPLTTIAQPFREIGKKAAEMLEKIIKGKDIDSGEVKLNGNLIIRESTAELKLNNT